MIRTIAPALTCALLLLPLPAAAEKVGNIGAANAAAFGTPPGASRHALTVGLGVEKGERIETATEGNAQITFNDSSTMTVGHSSSVVIDDFVYQGSGGSQGVRLAKGVMRFVGGGVSHQSGATLRAPMASIGVRGGSVLIKTGGDCGVLVVHQVGIVDVFGPNGSSQTLNRAGYGVCVNQNGVSEPFRVSGETISEITAEMESRGRQRGGAHHPPSNLDAAVALGNHAPYSVETPPGLDALAIIWGGNAVVQSRANVDNQPAPPPVVQTSRPETTPLETPTPPPPVTPTKEPPPCDCSRN